MVYYIQRYPTFFTRHIKDTLQRVKKFEYFSNGCAGFKKSRAPDTSEGFSYPNCGEYVACRYDSDWYIGLVKGICDAEGDIQVRFMHPKGTGKPDNCFFWPSAEDICFIPQHDILCSISAPIPSTKTARKYKVSLFDASQIIQYFEERT